MIKVNRSSVAPPSLAKGRYQATDVQEQLLLDFNGKCYLCECRGMQSIVTEHLIAHHGARALMLDWNNLFLSCSHCNSVKNQKKYEHDIIDCCKNDPEKLLNQTVDEETGEPFIEPIGDSLEAANTADLLNDCFGKGNTPYRKTEAAAKVRAFKAVMKELYKRLLTFRNNENDLRVVRGMLDKRHPFAGFTRGYVRNHLADYPELKKSVIIK